MNVYLHNTHGKLSFIFEPVIWVMERNVTMNISMQDKSDIFIKSLSN